MVRITVEEAWRAVRVRISDLGEGSRGREEPDGYRDKGQWPGSLSTHPGTRPSLAETPGGHLALGGGGHGALHMEGPERGSICQVASLRKLGGGGVPRVLGSKASASEGRVVPGPGGGRGLGKGSAWALP